MGNLLAHLAEKAQRMDVHISGLIRPRDFSEFSRVSSLYPSPVPFLTQSLYSEASVYWGPQTLQKPSL